MVLLIDVEFNEFKAYLRDNAAFLWTETTKAFVLIKPLPDMVVRTAVMKSDVESDNAFKVRELYKHTAKKCLNFTIDGKEIAPVATEETEGQIFEEKPEEVSEVGSTGQE